MIGTQDNLNEIIESQRAVARIKLMFVTPYAGGQPATKEGLEAFVEHQLGLARGSAEFEAAVSRITGEEIDTAAEGMELDEKATYGVNVIRGNGNGHYIPEHCLKAVLKQAATRMNVFVKSRGSKGDIAEFGSVYAVGESLQDKEHPFHVYLRREDAPAPTHYEVLQGRVSTASGKMSIQHHTLVAEAGSTIEFELRCGVRGMKFGDMEKIIAGMSVIGIGSCLSIGFGKVRVLEYEITGKWAKESSGKSEGDDKEDGVAEKRSRQAKQSSTAKGGMG